MAYENILTETRGRVGLITLNRPKQLNALNDALMNELGDALAAFEQDDGIGAIVITGNEKAFAAGADIGAMKDWSYMDVYKSEYITRNWERIRSIRKPVIAAVAGFALGGGCEIALACDIVIAADTAKFGQPEIKLGVIPGAGGTQRLPRAVGKAKAMDLILTGRMMDAAEAERAGTRVPGRPRGEAARGSARGGERDRRVLAAVGDDGEGSDQPRLREPARRRHPVRAAPVPLALRHRGPEGRDGGVRREAEARIQAQVVRPIATFAAIRALAGHIRQAPT